MCKAAFRVTDTDLNLYEKVVVPVPAMCPTCRLQQRLVWRNEKSLYRRNCYLCKKAIISIYSPNKPFTVYCRECFHGDGWDALSYGMDFDTGRPFLEQFRELQLKVPRISSFVFQNTASDYTNGSAFNKNCYMIFVSDHNEDCMYSYSTFNSRNSSDLLNCSECESCYESLTCTKCYQTSFSEDCSNSQNLLFCKNCVNCQDCVGCTNLRNARYSIFNETYSKEEYIEKLAALGLASREGFEKIKLQAEEQHAHFPVKYFHGLRNSNVLGDYVSNSKNANFTFDSDEVEDCQYINHGHQIKDSADSYVLVDKSELSYQVVSGIALSRTIASYCVWHGYDIAYTDTAENSHHLFGCVGLRKKEYCILNKQYSKEEYEILVAKIKEQMNTAPYLDEKGVPYVYGDFFPQNFSPFAYNETVAEEYEPLTESEVKERGFVWKKEEQREYVPTLQAKEIPTEISNVPDSITKEVIACSHAESKCNDGCATAFRITPDELALYRRLAVPVPTLCFNCRHAARTRKRNPRKLWQRQCMCESLTHGHDCLGESPNCLTEFETSYAPERAETVYCETCYQKEVS